MDPILLRQLVSAAAIFVAAAGLTLFARRLVLSCSFAAGDRPTVDLGWRPA
jgi:hypothetical protein